MIFIALFKQLFIERIQTLTQDSQGIYQGTQFQQNNMLFIVL